MAQTHEARELQLHIDNTREIAAMRDATCAMLAKHVMRGTYDADKAVRAFRYLADAGARSYTREFILPSQAGTGFGCFSVAHRQECARDYRDWFDSCRQQGVIDDLGVTAADILRRPVRRVA